MYALLKKLTLTTLVATFAQTALAADYQITVQGQLAKDIFSSSFFGITDASVPVQVSFVVSDTVVTHLSAGTPVDVSSGASFNSQAHLVDANSISNLVATIGNVSFTEAELVHQGLGTSSHSYDILLLGSLSENGLSAVQFNFNNASGSIQFGNLVCGASCGIQNIGAGFSNIEGSPADLSGIQVYTQALTPPPTPKQLLVDLAADIKAASTIKPLIKLALDVPLVLAALALKKGNLVQATNSMKAFIALLQPLVKCKSLTQAQADDFKAQAQGIIASM